MKQQKLETPLGDIAVTVDTGGEGEPVVFMHGVFLDRTLWADCGSSLTGRTHVYIDMPAHGDSSDVGRDWTLDECAKMLIAVLDKLDLQKVVAIGHSWGSMTILRAAIKCPSRFAAVGLFNMPFRRSTGLGRLGFTLQKYMAVFPRFYAKQAAKSLYSKRLLRARPDLMASMENRLSRRPPEEIARVIDAVILNAEDASHLLHSLRVPALAVVGESDYVGAPPSIDTIVVQGGHVSPHETPIDVRQAIKRVVTRAFGSAETPAAVNQGFRTPAEPERSPG